MSRRPAGSQDLDLVPIMNLVTILIPFLLFSASFVSLATIDSTLPAFSDEKPADDAPETSGAKLLITGDGYTLRTDAEPIEDGLELLCRGEGCASAGSYDHGALRDALADIKQYWPEDDTLIITSEEEVQYEILVAAMDAVRVDELGQDLYPAVVLAGGAPGLGR